MLHGFPRNRVLQPTASLQGRPSTCQVHVVHVHGGSSVVCSRPPGSSRLCLAGIKLCDAGNLLKERFKDSEASVGRVGGR